MLTEIYIEAILVDEVAADEIWELWVKHEISDFWAMWVWLRIGVSGRWGIFRVCPRSCQTGSLTRTDPCAWAGKTYSRCYISDFY